MFNCIIFDIDGTLIDTEKAAIYSLQKTLREVTGREYEYDKLTFVFGIPGFESLKSLNIANIPETLDLWNRHMKEYYNLIKVYPGIEGLLKALKYRNITTGIVTSKTDEEYQDDFIPFGIADYFKYIVKSTDTKLHKPNPDPILEFLEISGVDPSKAIYVGDTTYDMECARNAGIEFALALWGAKNPDSIDAKHKLIEPGDLLKLV